MADRQFLERHFARLRDAGKQRERLMRELEENEQVARQLERQGVLPTGILKEWREELV